MEYRDDLVVRGEDKKKMQVDGAETAESSSFEVSSQREVHIRPSSSSSLLPPLPATKPGKISAPHGQLPRPGLRSRGSIEKNLHTVLTVAQRGSSESMQAGLLPSPLWNKRTSSLPVRTNALNPSTYPDSNKGHSLESETNEHCEPAYPKVNIIRSFSTPVFVSKLESFRKDGSDGKGYVVLRSASPRIHRVQPPLENEIAGVINQHILTQFDADKGKGRLKEKEEDEAISEEEAVCRICMDPLTEDFGETLKMECRCLGEMALAHKECAFKWFGIKGDRVCEVCGSVVSNIPVTVVRFPSLDATSHLVSRGAESVNRASVWKDMLFMGVINILAYFVFMEHLLVYKLGIKALVISIPFSVMIGSLSSITTIALVRRRYVWLYAFIQFALVCFFGYVFFFEAHLEAVLAILLAAFSSFAIAMTSNALILEYLHWKECRFRRLQSSASSISVEASSGQETSDELATSPSSQEVHSSQTSREFDIENGSANSRSPNDWRQAASEVQSTHYS